MVIQHKDNGYITEIPNNKPVPYGWYKIIIKSKYNDLQKESLITYNININTRR